MPDMVNSIFYKEKNMIWPFFIHPRYITYFIMESDKVLQNGKEAIMKGCGSLLLVLIGAVLLVKFSLSLIYYAVIAAIVLWILSKVL